MFTRSARAREHEPVEAKLFGLVASVVDLSNVHPLTSNGRSPAASRAAFDELAARSLVMRTLMPSASSPGDGRQPNTVDADDDRDRLGKVADPAGSARRLRRGDRRCRRCSGMSRATCSPLHLLVGDVPAPSPRRQPAAADPLHARRRRGEHRRMPVGDVGDQRAEPDRGRRLGECAEQREAFQHRPVALDHRPVEVIEHPRGVVPLGLGTQARRRAAPANRWRQG